MNKQRVDFPVGENACQGKRGTPRGRLVKLLNKKYDHFCDQCGINKDSHYTESLADYLLANGVIVPPCKVGDVVWVKDFERCCVTQEAQIIEIVQNKYGTFIRYEYPALRGRIYARHIEYIGKTVFPTKEEAEAKLKEGVRSE